MLPLVPSGVSAHTLTIRPAFCGGYTIITFANPLSVVSVGQIEAKLLLAKSKILENKFKEAESIFEVILHDAEMNANRILIEKVTSQKSAFYENISQIQKLAKRGASIREKLVAIHDGHFPRIRPTSDLIKFGMLYAIKGTNAFNDYKKEIYQERNMDMIQ